MQLTYFFDVCSMWCALGDEALVTVQQRYGKRVPVTWKVALINDGEPMDAGLEQELWYYDRCEIATGRRFDHRWIEKSGQSTLLPNALIHVAQKLGKGAEVHRALKIAALERGEPILRREIALSLAVGASGLGRAALEAGIDDPETVAEIKASTAEFNAYKINQRPSFVIRSRIEDTVIFSGLYRVEPVIAAIDAMIADEEAYARFAASHAPFPPR
jgi:predicted DsbA family dithiol-disulfide isomerase